MTPFSRLRGARYCGWSMINAAAAYFPFVDGWDGHDHDDGMNGRIGIAGKMMGDWGKYSAMLLCSREIITKTKCFPETTLPH